MYPQSVAAITLKIQSADRIFVFLSLIKINLSAD